MAFVLLDAQGTPATPAAGKVIVYPDSSSQKQLTAKNENGRVYSLDGVIRNWNTADVVANAADTYLTGSSLVVPQHLLQAGATFKWRLAMTKTLAGVAAPIWTLRVGTTGTTADAARNIFTSSALQTAVVDTGIVEINAILRNTGATGVVVGTLLLTHNLAATGFAAQQVVVVQSVSSIDTTVANLIIGISCNPGAAGVWTHQIVAAEVANM